MVTNAENVRETRRVTRAIRMKFLTDAIPYIDNSVGRQSRPRQNFTPGIASTREYAVRPARRRLEN